MRRYRELCEVKLGGQRVHIFQNIAYSTLKKRKELKKITICLNEAKVKYRWGSPFKFMFTGEGNSAT